MKQVDTYIFRGPHPSFTEKEVDATLDLESGKQVFGDSSPLAEAISGEMLGIRVYPHPLGGILPPSIDEIREAVQFLSHQNSLRMKTLVHCAHGHERTGIVCAAYRITEQGWGILHAIDEMLSEGFHWIYLPWAAQLWRL